MKTIAKKIKSASVLLMGVILFTSCVKDILIESDSKNGQAEISFNFTTPAPMKVQTRSTAEEENYVETLHLLIFNSGKLVKTVTKTNAELSSSSTATSKDTWGLKTTLTVGKQYDFVTVVNVSLPAATVVGVTKADFIAAINAQAFIEANLTNTTKWMVSNTKPIPMWGEVSTGKDIISTDEFSMPLKRMMARVNVSVAGAAQTNFELTQVRFYNYNTKGQLIPNYVSPEYIYPSIPAMSGKQTTAAPAYFGYNNIDGVTATACQNLIYVFENANVGKYSDGVAKKWEDNPCLVIGGKFGGGTETFYRLDFVKVESGSEIWLDVKRNHSYNFNITKVNGNGYVDPKDALLSAPENIEHIVTPWDEENVGDMIVDGNVQLTITPSSTVTFSKESEMKGVDIYTNWSKGWQVQKRDYSGTQRLRIEDSAGNFIDWIRIDHEGTDAEGEKRLNITVHKNDSGDDRKGFIYITTKADRIQHRLTVIQSNAASSLLVIENAMGMAIDVLEFVAADGIAPDEQKYKVKWTPKTETLYISLATVANPSGGVYEPLKWSYYNTESGAINNNGTIIYASPIDNQTGEVEFTIKPTPITDGVDGVNLTTDPFYERSEQISFRAIGSDGIMRKSLILQQVVMNAIVKPEALYVANGSDYTFNVKSNRPWRATLTDDGNGMITNSVGVVLGQGGYNLPNGTNVEFTTFNDFPIPTKIEGTGKVMVELMDNLGNWIAIKPAELFCVSGNPQPLSNSYIVAPNSDPILIPVKRANGYGVDKSGTEFRQVDWNLGDQITGKYTAELVWTDTPHNATEGSIKSLGDNGAVNMIAVAGTGDNGTGYILVIPGSSAGNAVVSASVGGKIVWSWHIWVVNNYNPDPATDIWMDRNLGATTNYSISLPSTSPSTLGLLYQWGRKDPMPSAAAYNQTTNGGPVRTYYLGDDTSESTVRLEAGEGTLSSSIVKPLTNYKNWQGSKPNFKNVDDTNTNDSWITGYEKDYDTGDKTIYDPCPDGWRVPVRVNEDNTTSTHYWGNETSDIGSKWDGNNGISWETKGGYYPAAGTHYTNGSGFVLVGAYGYYWSAAPENSWSGYCLIFLNGYFYPSTSHSRYESGSVRCVAEQP